MTVPKNLNIILAVAAAGLPAGVQELNGGAVFNAMNRVAAIDTLASAGTWFGPRGVLEDDPRFRQIIPYVVVRSEGKLLTYTRPEATGESRLATKSSIGFGGHVDISDYAWAISRDWSIAGPTVPLDDVLRHAANREMYEEIGLKEHLSTKATLGLLTDNTSPVNLVHIGLVEVWDVLDSQYEPQQDEVGELAWKTLAELDGIRDTLENWSKLTLDHLAAAER